MEKLRQKIREFAPLPERLGDSIKMISTMCSERRPPKMSIPCNWLDEDIYITTALKDAIAFILARTPRRVILDEINAERDRQEAKWGRQDHQPDRWLSILGEEFGEVCKAVCEASFPGYESTGDWSQYRKELIHVAAVAAAMAECFDRLPAKLEPTYFVEVIREDSGWWNAWDVDLEKEGKCSHQRTWNIDLSPYFMRCLDCGAKKRSATRNEVIRAHNKKAVAEARAFNKRYEEGL